MATAGFIHTYACTHACAYISAFFKNLGYKFAPIPFTSSFPCHMRNCLLVMPPCRETETLTISISDRVFLQVKSR